MLPQIEISNLYKGEKLNHRGTLEESMKLVLIYGPFASGKLTIATELQKITGFKFLENNVVNKPALQVFPFGSPVFNRISGNLRLEILREAALHNVDIITSLVYALGTDDEYIRSIVKAVTGEGGQVKFVRVTCPDEVLLKRVSDRSREGKGKIVDPDLMKEVLSKSDLTSKIPFVESFEVDSSANSAGECARMIKDYLYS